MNTDPNVAELWQAQEENEKLRTQVAALAGLLREAQTMLEKMSTALGSDEVTVPYDDCLHDRIAAALAAAGEGKA